MYIYQPSRSCSQRVGPGGTSAYARRVPLTTITKTFRFEAAHVLPDHPGKCSRLHGHSYRLDVTVGGPVGAGGMVMDFADLTAAVERHVLARCDHRLLNDILDNPTAERTAAAALGWLAAAGLPVDEVTLWETETSRATVRP